MHSDFNSFKTKLLLCSGHQGKLTPVVNISGSMTLSKAERNVLSIVEGDCDFKLSEDVVEEGWQEQGGEAQRTLQLWRSLNLSTDKVMTPTDSYGSGAMVNPGI